ncbi:ubiquitin carboxyl-terminal hydrolase 31 [Condylostylus longicornis]|uniref:ubiquitin carboxyl-terminal hydrolase 31 n=1 Tax=Condylostylus longicornis TaxID=2530218 RepID=UPI00244DA948|nr:ubiquitin carboxyl-terminal hydrolase 31 [Condylostylus longicornis]
MTEENSKNESEKNPNGKKVRRAFSMPRNPFRWSRKYKTNKNDSTIISENCSNTNYNSINSSSLCNSTAENKAKTLTLTSINNVENKLKNLSTNNEETTKHQNQSRPKDNNFISTANRVFRRSSFRKFLSRIAHHVNSVSLGANKQMSNRNDGRNTLSSVDRVPPIEGYQWAPDQTPGVTGLKNHGNTCFMNAVLQCLSHTDILAEYFVLDQYKVDLKRRNKINSKKFGTKGELTEQLANVLKALWLCKNDPDHSTGFKAVVDRYGTQFRSSTQHDAQEFLFWLLDKVHEDLNTASKKRYKSIKNNYGRPDEVIAAETLANHIRCNNSFVQAVFQAQFRSSLTCPRCKKQSNTFDPFHCVSVQLPQLSQQIIFITVLYVKQHPKQIKLGLTVPSGSPIIALREQLHSDTGIAINRIVLADINETGFSRVFCDSQPVSTLDGINTVYCIEIPEIKDENSTDLMLLIANVKKTGDGSVEKFGTPFCIQVNRDCSYVELQKKLLKEMSSIIKPETFCYTTPLSEMFQIRLQDPSADPDTYLEQVEHPLFMEIIDMALSVLSHDAGPPHIKLLLEWAEPDKFFSDLTDPIVEHESVSSLKEKNINEGALTLEQCLEHYTKAETLSAEDAWRCPNCQQYLPVVKTLGLWSLPDILVIHFKRFRQQHEKGPDSAKLTTMVKFPLTNFDMSPHLARDCYGNPVGNSGSNNSTLSSNAETSRNLGTFGSPWRRSRDHFNKIGKDKDPKDNRYDLYAVCYHQGDTLETGHYTAACKNPYDHQWYKFDDQRVTHVLSDNIQDEIVNNEAYMLFYQRRKIDNAECSGTSSTNSSDHWVSRIAASSVPGPPTVQPTTTSSSTVTPIVEASISMPPSLITPEDKPEIRSKESPKLTKPLESTIISSAVTEVIPVPIVQKPVEVINENKTLEVIVVEKTDEIAEVDIESLEFADNDANEEDDSMVNDTESKTDKKEVINTTDILQGESFNSKIKVLQELPTTSYSMIKSTSITSDNSNCNSTASNVSSNTSSSASSSNETSTAKKLMNGHHKDITDEIKSISDEIKIPNKSDLSLTESLTNGICWPIRKTNSPSSESISSQPIPMHNIGSVPIHGTQRSASGVYIKEHMLSTSLKSNYSSGNDLVSASVNLRHSFSTSSNYKLRECDTASTSAAALTMLRNSSNTCSKDTLIYIDQQNGHHSLIEDDDTFLGSRSLWISPVTPHKLITVSPKN